MPQEGVDTLLAALTVNKRLARKFVDHPDERFGIINSGYLGQQFNLDHNEIARMIVIEATDLADFTRQYMGYSPERS